jgi:hypothetical protein
VRQRTDDPSTKGYNPSIDAEPALCRASNPFAGAGKNLIGPDQMDGRCSEPSQAASFLSRDFAGDDADGKGPSPR